MPDLPFGIEATICVDEELRTPIVVPMGEEMGPGEDLRIGSGRALQLAVFGLQQPDQHTRELVLAELARMPEFADVIDDATGLLPSEVLPPAGVDL